MAGNGNGNGKAPVLVVVELVGGNDFINTLVPYTSADYYDARKTVSIPEDQVLPHNDKLGFHPDAGPLKEMFDDGKVAIVQGVGLPNSSRSHFRARDVSYTCDSETLGTEGWLGRAIRDLDPKMENVLTGINFGRGLHRAMTVRGVPVTSVGDLDNYGLMTSISDKSQRDEALEIFKQLYAPAIGTGAVTDYLERTGTDVLAGADVLSQAPAMYSSEVEYADNPIARALRDVARVHTAGLGTRIFYATHGGYDTHANELVGQSKLLGQLSSAITDFQQDLEDHDAADEVLMLVITEFGRRMKDNGSGTDHGAGGGYFLIGERVNGGLYAEYPSLDPKKWSQGEDLQHTVDFRGVYSTVLEQWMGLDATPIVDGTYEQIHPFN
jgi:uncharacterized protein (DUF1501 family)